MKVSEFREIAVALGKYATTREKAKAPEAVIGVQTRAGTGELKLISGNERAGIVVGGIPDFVDANRSFTISARPFLQAAKALPAKSEVEMQVDEHCLILKAGNGGSIQCDALGTIREAGFPRKPREFKAWGDVSGVNWKRIGALFRKVSAKVEVPAVRLVRDTAYAIAVAPGERPQYVAYRFPGGGESGYNMSAYRDFWSGLSALRDDGVLRWGRSGVLAISGNIECFSAPYLVSRYDAKKGVAGLPEEAPPWPIMQAGDGFPVWFEMNRRDLINIVKGQAPFDELNRVTLEVSENLVKVMPFGEESGQSFVPIGGGGVGMRSVSAGYLEGLLSNMDSKEVTLRWGGGSRAISITAGGYEDWTILLAPTGL